MDNQEQQLQPVKVVESEIQTNTTYVDTCKPLQEEEFERLPEYVQQFIILSQEGTLPSTTKEELKTVVDQFFSNKK